MPARIISSPVQVEVSNIAINQLIFENIKRCADRTFLIEYETGKEYTYATLLDDSLRVAFALKKSHVEPGDVFMVYGFNCYEYIVALLSGLFVGGIALPMRGVDTTSEFHKEVDSKDVRLLFIASKLRDAAVSAKNQSKQIKDVILFDNIESDSEFNCIRSLVRDNDRLKDHEIYDPRGNEQSIAVIIESSGTTGPKKGTQYGHYDIVTPLLINKEHVSVDRTVVLGASPIAQVIGLQMFLGTIAFGLKIVSLRDNTLENTIGAIGKCKVNAAIMSPTMINELVKDENPIDISSLQKVFVAGSRMPKGLGDEFVQKFKPDEMRNCYTMTEIWATATIGENKRGNFESIGKIAPGMQIKIVDTETENILGENEIGEIRVKGPFTFKGYYKNAKLSKELLDSDGFIKTGDIGYFDESENFFLIDRKKEILKSRYGSGYSPVDVEEVLVKHDAVKEVAVVGIPEGTTSETSHAFVVLKASAKKESIDKQQMINFVNKQLSPVKHLKVIHFVDELPKTDIGKILRRVIRDEFLKNNLNN